MHDECTEIRLYPLICGQTERVIAKEIHTRARAWNGTGSASVIKHVHSDGMEAATVLSHAKRACHKTHVPQSRSSDFSPF